jgi:prevent-host-death family protein
MVIDRGGLVMSRQISVSRFKAECLRLLEEITQTGDELVITKRGRPLARVRSARQVPELAGSIDFLVSDDELMAPVGQDWDAAHG